MRTIRLIAAVVVAVVAVTGCTSVDHETMVADAVVAAEAAGIAPAELAYVDAVAQAAARAEALEGIAVGADGNPVAPYTDVATGITVTQLTLECQDGNGGLGWVAPSLTMEAASSTDTLNNIMQRVAFFGAFGEDGTVFESLDDLTAGQEETFGEFGVTGNPGDFSGDYAAICGADTWPVQVNLTDSAGNVFIAMLDAEVLSS